MRDFDQIRVYKWALIQCRNNGFVSLKEIEERFPELEPHIFSWMQWTDAHRFFHTSSKGNGITYETREEFKSPEGHKLAMQQISHLGIY